MRTKYLCVLMHIRNEGEVDTSKIFNPFSNFLAPSQSFFCGSFLLFVFYVCLCHTFLFVLCSLVVTYLEMAAPLGSIVCAVFLCFCHFPIWYPGSGTESK